MGDLWEMGKAGAEISPQGLQKERSLDHTLISALRLRLDRCHGELQDNKSGLFKVLSV